MGFNLGIIISGRGSNMLNIVNASQDGRIKSKVKIVISNKKNSEGIERVKKKNIKTMVIDQKLFNSKLEFENTLSRSLLTENVNFLCLPGFMKILSPLFLSKWNNKVINIHPSLLPSVKGKNAVKQALDNKAKTTGCTVHYVDKGVDTGKIMDQEKVLISNSDDEETLTKKILKKEHILYIRVLRKLERMKL